LTVHRQNTLSHINSVSQASTPQFSTVCHRHESTASAYQSVTTLGVIGRNGTPYVLASPKSAEHTHTDVLTWHKSLMVDNLTINLLKK